MKEIIFCLLTIAIFLIISALAHFKVVKSKHIITVLFWIILYCSLSYFYFYLINEIMNTSQFRKIFYDVVDPKTDFILLFFLSIVIVIVNTIVALVRRKKLGNVPKHQLREK